MDAPPGEPDSSYRCAPHSLREIHSVFLQISLAGSETERKQVLDSFGMTIEEFGELFGHVPGVTGLNDD
ncbi:hypothetical protein ABZ330_23135 [Streptomyces sp. NPDC006172]|uniref:hypothetical protein n=1 Tax=Streptomyces sp. NPDC006172 TaxID=3154470 RepID=UPI0033E815C7